MHVGLLSGQVFSPFDEDWLAGSHGGSGMSRAGACDASGVFPNCGGGRWALGIGGGGVEGRGVVCVLQAR